MKILGVSLRFLLLIKTVDAFQCFSCNQIDDPLLCNKTVTCSGTQEFCYMHVQGGIYDMGCSDNKHCGGVPDIGIVGRGLTYVQPYIRSEYDTRILLDRRSSNCAECCSMDNCNIDLCQHLKPTQCIDDETVDCAKMNSIFHICNDTHQAKLVCPKFCNLCKLVDGIWAEWSNWGTCSLKSGVCTQSRFRTCTNPAPAFGGLGCEGRNTETRKCSTHFCPGVCAGKEYLNSSLTNVAKGKGVTLSSLFDSISPGSLMVDGNRDSSWPCACTLNSDHPYAIVDLQHPFNIHSMYIVNRGDCCPERLNNLAVFVGNSTSSLSLAAQHPGPIAADCILVFDSAVHGRYVKLQIQGVSYLTICELEIYAD